MHEEINILLSPACSSKDLYKDYAERGNEYHKAVLSCFAEWDMFNNINIDRSLGFTILSLLILGTVMVYSARLPCLAIATYL